MSTETLPAPPPVAPSAADVPACHALHVKAVPYDVWCRARHNANLSRMTLRDYVIRILAEAKPYSIHPGGVPTAVPLVPASHPAMG